MIVIKRQGYERNKKLKEMLRFCPWTLSWWWLGLYVHLRARQALDHNPENSAQLLIFKKLPWQQSTNKTQWDWFFHLFEPGVEWFQALKRTGIWKWLLLVWGFVFLLWDRVYVALAVLEFIQISDCLRLPNAGLKVCHHHAGQFVVFFEGRSYCTAQAGFKLTIFPPWTA